MSLILGSLFREIVKNTMYWKFDLKNAIFLLE
jgi:hypothetical protein